MQQHPYYNIFEYINDYDDFIRIYRANKILNIIGKDYFHNHVRCFEHNFWKTSGDEIKLFMKFICKVGNNREKNIGISYIWNVHKDYIMDRNCKWNK